MEYPKTAKLVEVGPRDGLQNEPQQIPVATKIAFIDQLSAAGLPVIEVGSFVSSRRVPQMADTDAALAGITRRPGTNYPVLVPNQTGFDAALRAGASEIAIFAAASESFSRHNINCTIAESLQRFRPICAQAKEHGIAVRGYISCVVGCPYEGPIAPARVAEVASNLMQLGAYEISLGDTIGVGTPGVFRAMLEAVIQRIPVTRLAVHCHDTYGQAIANIHTSLTLGVRVIDSASAGLGGCPFAPGAAGNVASEDVIYLLHGLGIETGVDLGRLVQAGRFIAAALGRENCAKTARAWQGRTLSTPAET